MIAAVWSPEGDGDGTADAVADAESVTVGVAVGELRGVEPQAAAASRPASPIKATSRPDPLRVRTRLEPCVAALSSVVTGASQPTASTGAGRAPVPSILAWRNGGMQAIASNEPPMHRR